jgi:predicted HTH transcriptional regulator
MFTKNERPAANAHMLAELESGTKLAPQDVIRELAARWKALSAEEQTVWTDQAKEANSAASSAVVSEEDSPDEAPKENKKKEKKEKKAELEEKLKKPAGYLLFAKDVRSTLKKELTATLDDGEKLKARDVAEATATRWKELEDAEKLEWNEKANPASSDEEA